jgi:hypothetical protein
MFSLVIESSGFFTPDNPASYKKNLTMKVSKLHAKHRVRGGGGENHLLHIFQNCPE